ncbi:MAG TPA: IS21 family transposase, partial [Solirubrobacteraceae bacterium]
VLVWSRVRFVRFALDERRETTLRLLAECFEELGGVSAVVLADRMGCLKAGIVANVVVPHPEYVRFATHFGFRPDFCEAHDPESKGVVENLVGYAKADLVIPLPAGASVAEANQAAIGWCAEVNSALHSETMAIPAERLVAERSALRALPSLRPPLRAGERRTVDRLATIRFGSARYSVPAALVGTKVEVAAVDGEIVITHDAAEIARHLAVAPGEASILDAHYGGPRSRPARAVRPRSAAERAFLALGDPAERFLRAAAAAGTARLGSELAEISSLEAAFGRAPLVAAIERATSFHRFRSADIRAILVAGLGVMGHAAPGAPLQLALPAVPVRPLSAYALS